MNNAIDTTKYKTSYPKHYIELYKTLPESKLRVRAGQCRYNIKVCNENIARYQGIDSQMQKFALQRCLYEKDLLRRLNILLGEY